MSQQFDPAIVRSDVGVVGLGRMGGAMVSRLLAKGHRVSVYNRTRSSADQFVASGALIAETPMAVAKENGVVISTLPSEQATLEACLGAHGILSGLRGGTHINMATIAPDVALRLSELHEAAGVTYISAPVQGRPASAEAGQLVGWVSGPSINEAASRVLDDLCRLRVWLGSDVRHACVAKLAINYLMFVNIAAFSEAFAYLDMADVDRDAFASGLTQTLFQGPLFSGITQKLLAGEHSSNGSDVLLTKKDLHLLSQGLSTPEDLPLARRLEEIFQNAIDQGLGHLDPVAIRRVVSSVPFASKSP